MDQIIAGVTLRELKQIKDDRGMVMHMIRKDSDLFAGFGEIYFSIVNPGIVKGWKKHFEAVQLFAVPKGKIKIVLFDDRTDSPTRLQTQEILMGLDDYKLLRIPPRVWYAFQAISNETAMICNLTTLPHEPTESTTLPLDTSTIPYQWDDRS